MPVLERGTPTPPGTLVFVPIDSRAIMVPDRETMRQAARPALTMWVQPTPDDVARSAAWVLVPCLVSLRGEFNALAPGRDKSSDGSIGDTAHASSSSDHNPDESGATPYEDSDRINEVHAIDVDKSLQGSPLTMQQVVDIIVARHRSGKDDRLQNVIFNRRIWSRSWNWSESRPYGGSNPHDKHAHFSARYLTAQERDERPWGLLEETQMVEEDDMATITQDDFNKRMDAWWAARMPADAKENPARAALRISPWHQLVGAANAKIRTYDELFGPNGMRRQVSDVHGVVTALADGEVDDIAVVLSRLLGPAKAAELGAALSAGTPNGS
jgi:hypothetical protein